MARVRFIMPFTKLTGSKYINIEAADVRELCKKLIQRFGSEMNVLLDENDDLSRKMVILVNRRNAHTLDGANTALDKNAEVIIMHYISGG
ncbi:MAG TPA: MoaD/ThiS family protein [Clostridia bacterium]|nr:MoaD/ThiS family protein [Clostridia bacterium]